MYLPLLTLALAVSCAKETTVEESKETERYETEAETDQSIVQGETIVRFSDEMVSLIEDDLNQGKIVTRSMGLNQALDEIGITSVRRLFPEAGEYEPRTRREGLHKWYIVNFRTDVPQTRASAELGSVPGIEYVESHRKAVTGSFNDPDYSKQWGYINPKGYDINVLPVWNCYTAGDPKVIVAVVDEGVDITHGDLAANCSKVNYSSISYSGTVVAGSHGTHVAGTVAAVNNNGAGVCGVAGGDAARGEKGVTIMSCEILREITSGGKKSYRNGSSAVAIKWAADHGAVICQNSWAYTYDRDGNGFLDRNELADALAGKVSASDKIAIDYFIKYAGCDNDGNQLADSPMKGGLVVFAAGNDNITNGVPANYEPVIAVGAIDANGNKASYSNYGSFVDIAAPGSSIYSTVPGGKYGYLSGTSMACPHVSGAAALLVSCLGGPGFTCDELKERLLATKRKDAVPSTIGGLMDVMGALTYGQDFVPKEATDLKASVVTNGLTLSWPVSGDADGHPAYGYTILVGKDKSAVEAADPTGSLPDGITRAEVTTDRRLGEVMSAEIRDLDFSATYYAKVIGYSYSKTYGAESDIVNFTTGRNNPPVIELEGDDFTLKSHETKTLNVTIYDPDGHSFTTSYKSGSIADSYTPFTKSLTINAPYVEAGEYTAELTATDTYGASATRQIRYKILENNPPSKVKDIENMLITSIGQGFTLDLPDYFNDPDGEDLNYNVSVSNPSILKMSRNEISVGGIVLKDGSTTVTITASDSKNAMAKAEFIIVARSEDIEYSAYPNPVKDVLKVATGRNLEALSVKLTSQTGGTAFEGEFEASAFKPAEIDLSGCAPGKYQATFRFGGKEYSQTIIKK